MGGSPKHHSADALPKPSPFLTPSDRSPSLSFHSSPLPVSLSLTWTTAPASLPSLLVCPQSIIHYAAISRPCLKTSTAWFTHRVRSVSLGFQRFMTRLLPAALVFWHFLQMKLLAASSKYTVCFSRRSGLHWLFSMLGLLFLGKFFTEHVVKCRRLSVEG